MDILIVANFCLDFSELDNGRFSYLADMLSVENEVEVITSSFYHITKKQRIIPKEKKVYKVTYLYEPGYMKNISLKRFYSHRKWGRNVSEYIKKRKKPDVIYCAVPSLTAPYELARYCKKNNIKFIIDIQDLWPEAFKLAFDIPIVSNIIFSPFKLLVDYVYRQADVICGVSETYVNRALKVNKKNRNGHVVFLGTQLSTFDNNVINNECDIIKSDNEIWVGYCGTLGASYDISIVIKALHIIKKRGIKSVKFIIMGDGEYREKFELLSETLGVDCIFTGRLPYNRMCATLSMCDIAVNPIMHNAAQSIINKHGDYAAAGLPVINTQENKEYRQLVKSYKMGFNVRNNDVESFADRLIYLINNEETRNKMGRNARKCAKQKFDRTNTYKELVFEIVK